MTSLIKQTKLLVPEMFKSLGLVLASLLLLSGCSSNSPKTTSDISYVAGDGSTVFVARDERNQEVQLRGITLSGKHLDTARWQGKVVVVNLWASWCGPCRAEATVLANSYKELAPKGVEFVGLNTRDSLAAASAFNDRFPTGYESIQDQDGQLTLGFGNLGPAATPTTIVIDQSGKVVARILGPVTKAQLRGIVTAILDEARP